MSNKLAGRCAAPVLPILLAGIFGIAPFAVQAAPVTIETRVTNSADDAEEHATGTVDLSSSDLELVLEADNQVTGIRFSNLNIEPGAVITSAYIQFAVDENNSEATTLQIAAEATDSAPTFTTAKFGVSARPKTSGLISWSPPAWSVINQAGPDQRTPELASIVQEVVSRPGWQSGNSIAFIVAGTGKRVARAFNYSAALAPLLHIQYESTGDQAPTLTIANPADGTSVATGTSLTFTGSAADNEDGILSAFITWSSSRDGSLGTGTSVASILSTGTHIISASATDSAGHTVSKSITVNVTATSNAPPSLGIVSPADGTSVATGTSLTFTGSAADNEDGDLSASITWSSSLDGSLGTGASVGSILSVGTHIISASVTDSAGQPAGKSITVIVTAGGGATQTFDRQIAAGADDAEESSSGSVNISSADLELVTDASVQTVGMRFSNIIIPQGSVVTNAWLQFTVDEVNSEATNLILRGQASTNAASFTTSAKGVSTRPRTAAQVSWAPAAWSVVGTAGPEQRTPDLSAIINEIVGTSGWQSGNALAIIVNGTGKRVARAQNFAGAVAPLLHIEYIDSGANSRPLVDAGTDASIILPANTYNLNGTVTDDARPIGGTLTTLWTHQGGTGSGTVSFGNAASVDTTFSVSSNAGTYILRLTASDSDLSAYDEVTVTVQPQSNAGQIASITLINSFNTGFVNLTSPLAIPATDPAGVTYYPPSGHLIIADSEIDEMSSPFSIVQANLFEVPLAGGTTYKQWNTTLKTGNEPVSNREPTGIAYCENDGHFYVSNDDARRIYRYAYSNSKFTAVDSISLSGYANDAEDITCDPATGRLYVIDGVGGVKNVVVLRYQGGFVLENYFNLPLTAGSTTGVPADPEGIAFDAGSGHLFVISSPDKAIFEYTVTGVYVKKFSISGFSPATKAAQGIAIGPSSNNAQTTSFYITDGLIDNDQDPNERDGRIYEARINRAP